MLLHICFNSFVYSLFTHLMLCEPRKARYYSMAFSSAVVHMSSYIWGCLFAWERVSGEKWYLFPFLEQRVFYFAIFSFLLRYCCSYCCSDFRYHHYYLNHCHSCYCHYQYIRNYYNHHHRNYVNKGNNNENDGNYDDEIMMIIISILIIIVTITIMVVLLLLLLLFLLLWSVKS